MSSTSKSVVLIRILVALIVIGALAACVYIFFIKNNIKVQVYDSYNTILTSENQVNIDNNLGSLESGEYYTYASAYTDLNYKEVYLSYYMNKQVLLSYSDLLVYANDRGKGKYAKEIQNLLNKYKEQQVVLLRSQQVFSTNKENYGENPTSEQKEAILNNFKQIISDLKEMNTTLKNLSNQVFLYCTTTYYKNGNEFNNLKYIFTYALDQQAAVYITALTSENGVNENLYNETKAMVLRYDLESRGSFESQGTTANNQEVVDYFIDSTNNHFDDFLKADNKSEFITQITDTTQKAKVKKVAQVLGLEV